MRVTVVLESEVYGREEFRADSLNKAMGIAGRLSRRIAKMYDEGEDAVPRTVSIEFTPESKITIDPIMEMKDERDQD